MKKNRKLYRERNSVLFQKRFGFTTLDSKHLTGFTLTELLVAVAILAIAVLLAFHAFITVSTQRALAYNISAASNLAQDKLEELRNLAYGSVVPGTYSENDIDETGAAGGIFDRAWTVGADGVPIAETKTITVTVTWPYLSTTQTVTLWTIKGQ